MPVAAAGGALALADDLVLSRMGYGAMQLAGPAGQQAAADPRHRGRTRRNRAGPHGAARRAPGDQRLRDHPAGQV